MSHILTTTNSTDGELVTTLSTVVPEDADYCVLICGMRGADNTATTLSTTSGETALGSVDFVLNSGTQRRFDGFQAVEIGYILGTNLPTAGSVVVATATRGVATNGMILGIAFFSNTTQSAPSFQFDGATSSPADPFSVTFTLGADSYLIDGILSADGNDIFSPTSPQVEEADVNVSGGSTHMAISTRNGDESPPDVDMEWDISGSTARLTQGAVALGDAGNPASADITFYLVGGTTDTTAQVKLRAPGALATALEYSTSSDFTGSITTATQVPGSGTDFVLTFNLTGLTRQTQYFYRAIENGVDDSLFALIPSFTTFAPAGVAANCVVGAASCALTGSKIDTFARVIDKGVTRFIHMGDFGYFDISTNSEALYRTAYQDVFASVQQRTLFQSVSLDYIWDDHDYGTNNSGSTSPSKVAAASVYREYFPNYTLAAADSINRSYQDGRIYYIGIDTRYFAVAGNKLGSTQETWLLAELDAFAADVDTTILKFVNPIPWIATAVSDTWSDAAVQRTLIADKIFSLGIEDRVFMISGDMHGVAMDDGTNNIFDTSAQTGWPVAQLAALDQAASLKGGPYSEGSFTGGGQYGISTVTDTGASVSLKVDGYDDSDSIVATLTVTITSAALTLPTGVQTGEETADGTITTDTGSGTLYAIVSTSSVTPRISQMQAGQDATGAAAAFSTNQVVSGSGVQNVSATGLTQNTDYFFHFQQDDATEQTGTFTSAEFTTEAAAGGGTKDISVVISKAISSGISKAI